VRSASLPRDRLPPLRARCRPPGARRAALSPPPPPPPAAARRPRGRALCLPRVL
jgi:hypothetical protein